MSLAGSPGHREPRIQYFSPLFYYGTFFFSEFLIWINVIQKTLQATVLTLSVELVYNVKVETKVEYAFVVEATEKKNSSRFSRLSFGSEFVSL